jgi:hypothetical protein
VSTTTPDGARRQIEDNRRAVERAEEVSRRIREALAESQRVRREVLPKLKRAGYLH